MLQLEKKLENYPKTLQKFFEYMEIEKDYTEETKIQYMNDITLFLKYLRIHRKEVKVPKEFNFEEDLCKISIDLINEEFLKSISSEEIYSFLIFSNEMRNNNENTTARKTYAIKSFLAFLVDEIEIDWRLGKNIAVPERLEPNPLTLTRDQCELLLKSVGKQNEIRNKCIITFFLNMGIRLSELCRLNLSDINYEKGTVIITGRKGVKRLACMNDACKEAYKEYLKVRIDSNKLSEEHKDALFISQRKARIGKRIVENIVKDAVKKAGLDERISAHKLRNTTAALLKDAGVHNTVIHKLMGGTLIVRELSYKIVKTSDLMEAVQAHPLNIREEGGDCCYKSIKR